MVPEFLEYVKNILTVILLETTPFNKGKIGCDVNRMLEYNKALCFIKEININVEIINVNLKRNRRRYMRYRFRFDRIHYCLIMLLYIT